MRTWAKAPLIYVLALIRFPFVQSMGDFEGAFGQAIEGSYPVRMEHLNQVAMAEFGPDGLKFNTSQQTLWQFSREDKTRAIMLGPDFLLLHCTHAGYPGHVEFVGELISLLGQLSKVPGMTLTHLVSMGYRYVDLIIPGEAETLDQYLRAWAHPADFPSEAVGDMEFVDGGSVAAFRTKQGVLRFQAARHPPATLPPELDSPFVRENGWVVDRPEGDFALLDFDHGQQFASPITFSQENAIERMIEICQAGRNLFHRSVTDHARGVWEDNQREPFEEKTQ